MVKEYHFITIIHVYNHSIFGKIHHSWLTLAGLCTPCKPMGTKVGALGLNPFVDGGNCGGLLLGEPFSGEKLV